MSFLISFLKFSIFLFGFSSNADISNGVVFGKDMNTWLICTLIFFALTTASFLWVWLSDLVAQIKSGEPLEKPWE